MYVRQMHRFCRRQFCSFNRCRCRSMAVPRLLRRYLLEALQTKTAAFEVKRPSLQYYLAMIAGHRLAIPQGCTCSCSPVSTCIAGFDQSPRKTDRRSRYWTNGSNSRSLYSSETPFSIQQVAISVSIILRIVTHHMSTFEADIDTILQGFGSNYRFAFCRELRGQFKNPVRGCLLPRRAFNLGAPEQLKPKDGSADH